MWLRKGLPVTAARAKPHTSWTGTKPSHSGGMLAPCQCLWWGQTLIRCSISTRPEEQQELLPSNPAEASNPEVHYQTAPPAVTSTPYTADCSGTNQRRPESTDGSQSPRQLHASNTVAPIQYNKVYV